MDNNLLFVIIVAILALVVLVAFFRFRGKSKATIQAGPFGMSYEGSNPSEKPAAPAAPVEPPIEFEVTNIKAGKNADVSNQDGGRTRIDNVEAETGSVKITRTDGDPSPKA